MAQNVDLYDAILNGDAKKAHAATEAAIAAGVAPMALIQESMVPAMDEVGRLFECEEYFVPELLLAGRAMKGAMELLKPLLTASGQKMAVRVVIGTVKGDLHDIGKNIVASMLEGSGFEVIDLGTDVSPENFVAAVEQRKPHVVCMSALLTVTMPAMKRPSTRFRPRVCARRSKCSSAAHPSHTNTQRKSARTVTARTPTVRSASSKICLPRRQSDKPPDKFRDESRPLSPPRRRGPVDAHRR